MLALTNRLYPGFARIDPIAHHDLLLGLFWRVMSDIFVDLARRYAVKEVTCVNDVVHHIRDGLVAAAGNPITYKVTVGGEEIWVLPPEAAHLPCGCGCALCGSGVLPWHALPRHGFLQRQARQISPDISDFKYGALYADPIPSMRPAFL